MSTIAEQWHEQAEVREFSVKEVCDILSAVMCMNEEGIPDDLSIEDIILNSCSNTHDAKVIMDISEHIDMIGVHDVANTIAEHRKFYDV